MRPVKRNSLKQTVRRERYERLLDAVHTISSVVETVADGAINVPGLKSAAGLVRQIVERAQVSLFSSACAVPRADITKFDRW